MKLLEGFLPLRYMCNVELIVPNVSYGLSRSLLILSAS